jgi:hypothetical protein
MQSTSGVRGQASLLAAQRSRGHSSVFAESRGASAGRKSHSGFAKGEQMEKVMMSSRIVACKAARCGRGARDCVCVCCVEFLVVSSLSFPILRLFILRLLLPASQRAT